ncbi:hypothetical protein EBT25_15045, partial [bacterium]|nr:hypothetical protein [bacterium]
MPHVVFAIDESGSTAWFHAYHDRVYDIARRLSNRSQSDEKLEITVLNWSDRCYKGRLDETLANSAPGGPRRGGGGTYVTPLYDKLEVLETIDELILITDGEIDRGSVEKVFANVLGHGIKWKFTEAHIVSNGVPSVSVIAPFIYKTKYAIYDNTSYETPKAACAHVDVIEFIDGIRTEEQFRAEYDRLYDRISADTLVRADPSIRQSLLVMQKRIIANSASAAKDDELTLDAAAIEKCAVDWYNNATGLDISGMISRLVNMCSTTSHDLRLARFERSYKAIESVQVGDSDDTTIAVVEEICADYEDPVLMDKDMPVVLFMQGPGVLTGLDNDEIRREIERCPLNLLKYDFLVDAISKRINPVHGLRFCREYLASTKGQTTYYDDYYSDEDGPDFGNGGGEFVSPETRKPLMKEIMCLSVHESHTRANKACIAKLLSGTNRLCGQYGLWMVVFYSILKRRSFVNSEIGGVLDTFMKELAMNTPP